MVGALPDRGKGERAARQQGAAGLSPNASGTRHRRMGLPAKGTVCLALALLVPALLFAFLTLLDGVQIRNAAMRHAGEAAELGAERALRIMQVGQQALARAEDAVGDDPWTQLQAPERRNALVAQLRRIAQTQPPGLAVFVARGDGQETIGGPPGGVGQPGRLHELPGDPPGVIFTAAKGGPHGQLVLARAGPAPDGTAAAAVVALSADLFGSLWKALGREGCSFLMFAEDGDLLARHGDAPAGAWQALRQADGAPAVIRADLAGDGSTALLASRRVGELPLFVVHVVPGAPALAAWQDGMLANLVVSLAAGLVLLAVGLLARQADRANVSNLARLEISAAELRAEIERREAAEEGLRNAQRLEALGQLTGGVAHDFNNLLTAILGTARALERDLGPRADGRSLRLIGAIVAAVQRGARLNASLLAFARRQPLMLATVDTNALLRDFLPLLRRAMDETIAVELALDNSVPACLADAGQLEAALLNLAINARDAMPCGGTIRIATRRAWLQAQALAGNPDARPGPYVAIEIRDTGQGMAPEVLDRAFEPFFTTKPVGQGTGLGLSQVFGFMRQIGGHVAIQSAPGQGTAVVLYLPLGPAIEEARGGTLLPPASTPMTAAKGVSVLVVEDDPAVRAVATDILRNAGMDVLAAPDGPTALALLRDGARVDILFSDIVMPGGMSGVELAREARRLHPTIAVLLASGYAADALEKRGGAGEFELIGKPYDAEALLARLAAQARVLAR